MSIEKSKYSRINYSVIIGVMFFMIAGCGGLKINSNWNKHSITIDGNFDDWEKVSTHFDEEKGIIYGVVNDDESLNFMFRFRDIKLAQKLERQGITVWFNGEGKEKKIFGINYKNENAPVFNPGNLRERKTNQESKREQAFSPLGKFNIQGDNTVDIFSVNDRDDIEAKAGLNNGIFCYEFKIPLDAESKDKFVLNTEPGNNIKIGFEIAGISEEEKAQMKAKMEEKMSQRKSQGSRGGGGKGGGRGGGMGGGRGGGMKGGMGGSPGGSSQNDMMKQFEAQEFWATVKLAKQVSSKQ